MSDVRPPQRLPIHNGLPSTVQLQIDCVKLMQYLADLGLPCRYCGLYLREHGPGYEFCRDLPSIMGNKP